VLTRAPEGAPHSGNAFGALHAALVLRKDLLAQADGLRSDFDPLVFVDPLQALLERHLADTGQSDQEFGSGGANVGQLLFTARIDVEVIVLAVLADDHAFVDRHAGAEEQDAAVFETHQAVFDRVSGTIRNQRADQSVRDLTLVGFVSHEKRAHQACAARGGQVLRAHAEKAAGRDVDFEANASHALRFILGQDALALLEQLRDFAGELLWQVEDGALHRLEASAVFRSLVKDLRLAHHELEAFTADLLNEDGELKFAAAEDSELVRRHAVLETQGNVVADFAQEAVTELARLDSFAFLAGQGRGVDGEHHGQGRLFDDDSRQRLDRIVTDDGIADFDAFGSGDHNDVTRHRFGDFDLLQAFVGQKSLDVEGLIDAGSRLVDAAADDPLVLLERSAHHAADGQASDVIRVGQVRYEHLETLPLGSLWGGNMLQHGVEQGLERALLFAGHHLRNGVEVGGAPAVAGRCVKDWKIELLLVGAQLDEEVEGLVHDFLNSASAFALGAVDLVDAEDDLMPLCEGLLKHEAGLRQRAFSRIDKQDGPIAHPEDSLHLAAEVGVSRSIDDVDLVTAIADRGVLGHDRDAALALQIHRVHDTVADAFVRLERAGLLEEMVDQGSLAMVNVGDDAKVAKRSRAHSVGNGTSRRSAETPQQFEGLRFGDRMMVVPADGGTEQVESEHAGRGQGQSGGRKQVAPHSSTPDELFSLFESQAAGLNRSEAERRLSRYGENVFPSTPPPSLIRIFFRQFLNPLIYVLLVAAVVALLLQDIKDAVFIGVILLLNAIIGTVQEFGAEKSAQALREMSAAHALVEREGEVFDVEATQVVPGDVVLLESGRKVPADLRLFSSHSLEIDESLLTGESLAVAKDHRSVLEVETALGDRMNVAFSGSLVTRGRARGLVVATGLRTELGKIAEAISGGSSGRPPLLIRMESFTTRIAVALVFVTALLGLVLLMRGQGWHEVLIFSTALAVAAIPEGLPVALTVALSIASRRMAKRNVLVRKLPAVEALGSCTLIATDKTGTLTVNQLTIQKVVVPEDDRLREVSVKGSGIEFSDLLQPEDSERIQGLVRAGILCNEGQLARREQQWVGHGDAVDVAFLVLARKAGVTHDEWRDAHVLKEELPFEPENQFAATAHESIGGAAVSGATVISVKGALEKVLPMCRVSEALRASIQQTADQLADQGLRVLGLAGTSRDGGLGGGGKLLDRLGDLEFLGLAGMMDPLRPEAAEAIDRCHRAGIEVVMVTGDHPKTALAISRELRLASAPEEVVSGPQLRAASPENRRALMERAKVFARVEPRQKLEIVQHLLQSGHFVAVTGDGANDAPALRAANVGVAMGRAGTDVAKETADLILLDDRFASIVAGIEQGRIAYSNVRKVVYLLISTGLAEILMFSASLAMELPLPLTAAQVLWLNLVTNGFQDLGLAFEPGEGTELQQKPRLPNESIFNRQMIEGVVLSALVMGGVSFWYFNGLIQQGMEVGFARNLTLLLMVLFENVMVAVARSELVSTFSLNPLRNPLLLIGTTLALGVHILSMHWPPLGRFLDVSPVSREHWGQLIPLALALLFATEVQKFFRRKQGTAAQDSR
jgi:Ca2+-transporting ATPase